MSKAPRKAVERVTLDLALIQTAASYLEDLGNSLKHEPIRKLVRAIDAQLSGQM